MVQMGVVGCWLVRKGNVSYRMLSESGCSKMHWCVCCLFVYFVLHTISDYTWYNALCSKRGNKSLFSKLQHVQCSNQYQKDYHL